jgi:hypothetical protein
MPRDFNRYKDWVRDGWHQREVRAAGRTATYRYYYEAGYKYWIIGVVLNRAKLVYPPNPLYCGRARVGCGVSGVRFPEAPPGNLAGVARYESWNRMEQIRGLGLVRA